jgi:hypothetical protein
MNHLYGVNKYTHARYCTETDLFLKTARAGSVSGFGGEISGSGKKVRIRNTGKNYLTQGETKCGGLLLGLLMLVALQEKNSVSMPSY